MKTVGTLLLLTLTACVRSQPPAASPAPVQPQLPIPAPPLASNDLGRVIVDAEGAAADVYLPTTMLEGSEGLFVPGMHDAKLTSSGESLLPLCRTPCFVDLPRGRRVLRLFPVEGRPRADYDPVDIAVAVGAEPTVVRVASIGEQPSTKRAMDATLPGALTVAGGLSLGGVGVAVLTDDDAGKHTRLGASLIGIGGALVIAGVVWALAARPESRMPTMTIWTAR